MTLRGRFFTIKLVIRSLPGDFLIGIFFITLFISSGDVALAGRDIGRGDSRKFSTISS